MPGPRRHRSGRSARSLSPFADQRLISGRQTQCDCTAFYEFVHRLAPRRRHARKRLPRRDRAHPGRPHGDAARPPRRRARQHRRDPPRAYPLLRGARPEAEGAVCGDELRGKGLQYRIARDVRGHTLHPNLQIRIPRVRSPARFQDQLIYSTLTTSESPSSCKIC